MQQKITMEICEFIPTRRMEMLRLKRLICILHLLRFHNFISTLLQAIAILEELTLSFEELNKVRRSFVGGGLFEGGCKSDCKTFFLLLYSRKSFTECHLM